MTTSSTPGPGLTFAGAMRRGSFHLQAEFACAPGEVLGVLGPNGSGKSTLIAGVCGLERLTSGALHVGSQLWDDGRGHTLPPGHRRVGLMTAAGDIFGHLDALENVAFVLRARGVSRAKARERAQAELDQVGLGGLGHRRPHELSSGQAQRVALARALVLQPRVLLLDEPLSAIDAEGRHELRALLAERLRALDAVTLLVTHDPIEALTLADRLLVLDDGEVAQQGAPADVVRRPRSPFAARLVGLNVWRGHLDGAILTTPAGTRLLAAHPAPGASHESRRPGASAADHEGFGAFSPTAVSLWGERPEGSPRNTWRVVVEQIELTGTTARVHLGGEADLVADVTLDAVAALDLGRGSVVHATLKATDVTLYR